MKEYSILIVGIKCYSGHIREFIVNLKKKNPNVKITLVATNIREEFRDELLQYANRIVILKKFKERFRIPYFIVEFINKLYFYLGFLRLYFSGHFDIVDIHFPKGIVNKAMPILKRMTDNIVITPWGSDVMRVEDEKSIIELKKIYAQARYVTVSQTSQIGKCAISKFNVNPDKFVKLGWGGEFFDFIHENDGKLTTETAKARFGLEGRFVITCGYNTQKEQRHEDIVNAIYEVKDKLPNTLTLLFPFTYGRSAKSDLYTKTIVEKSKALGFDVAVVDEHLDLSDLLKLRMATDIFVHVQDSDAGSRCVMEYVLCNKKVVHGAWMKYVYLEDYKPSCYFPIDQMKNLGDVIVKAYNSKIYDLPQELKTLILERGWNNRMTKWNSFFESLLY